jgi:DNA-binding transcriptional MerR regulator
MSDASKQNEPAPAFSASQDRVGLPILDGIGIPRATSAPQGRPIQVGDLARAAGKTVRAIHLYEELGLLRPVGRSKGRYRLYGPEALTRIRFIGKLQDLGLSLNDIRAVVREWESSPSAPGAMSRMREVYRRKLLETREQIGRLVLLERELAASLAYLETCDSCDPARLLPACSACDLHECSDRAPELVAGFSARAT